MPNGHPCCRPYPMAVRTNDFTLNNLQLSLRNALGVAYVQGLAGSNMVELQSNRVRAIAAICAALPKLVGIQPIANASRALIGLTVDLLSVSMSLKSALAPRLHLLRCELSFGAVSISAPGRTEPGRSLGVKCLPALSASECFRRSLGPWGHVTRVSPVAYPCKPDIFAATYEVAT